MGIVKSISRRLFRLKSLKRQESSQLDKCLTTFDLTALGVGATLGVGIYVLSGSVAKDVAGPSVVLSFLIAGIASSLSGLCYAELGARVPKAGSAYIYSYVTVGEVVAFIIGWNLILEYAIGTASIARGYSGYLDSLLNKSMEHAFRKTMPIDIPFLSPYPDICAFTISQVLTIILCIGVKESTRVNNVFTCLNIGVVGLVVLAGFIKSNTLNWSIPKENLPHDNEHDYGEGGFFPYGISGTLAGAATCFYGYVGFDSIATSGEETKNPQFSIPVSICVSLLFVFVAYCGISSVLTLMIPYYLQDSSAPLPFAFHSVGWPFVGWVVSIGALFGLSTSLLGAMFPLPRVLYAMSSDGLIFRWLSAVHPKYQTPLRATLIAGLFSGLMATFFELKNLVDMMSIGTLMAYTIVAICVTLLRYQDFEATASASPTKDYLPLGSLLGPSPYRSKDTGSYDDEDYYSESDEIVYCSEENLDIVNRTIKNERDYEPIDGPLEVLKLCLNIPRQTIPSGKSSRIAAWLTVIMTVLCALVVVILIFGIHLLPGNLVLLGVLIFLVTSLAITILFLSLQPTTTQNLSFKVPLVPILPAASIFINLYLMMKLSAATWVRFTVWMIIGGAIYLFYGWRNASEEYRYLGKVPPNERKQLH